MNLQLRQTVGRYEAMNSEMMKKFAKLSEERIRLRDEMARLKVQAEETATAAEIPAVPATKKSAVSEQSVPQPIAQGQPSEAIMTKKEMQQSVARERAEKAKAEVEALLGRANTAPQPWEERESHL